MAVSNTKIGKRMVRKQDPMIKETILVAKKLSSWKTMAQTLSTGRRRYINLNLGDISKLLKNETSIAVAGKVLGNGKLDKNVKISALYFSKTAEDKLKKQKIQTMTILEHMKENPDAKEVLLLR